MMGNFSLSNMLRTLVSASGLLPLAQFFLACSVHSAAHKLSCASPTAPCSGVAGHAHKHWGSEFTSRAILVRVLALVMMLISIFMAIYAAVNFKRRGDMLL